MLNLHNTLTRNIETVKPESPEQVTVYTCGLTVYSQPHIGNWVIYIYWDILVRTLRANGLTVRRVQNITDVGHLTSDEDFGEDKMLIGAEREGISAWDIAERYIEIADHEANDLLGLLRPDNMPRATDYISQQIELVKTLEEKDYTYEIKNDGIYFDTSRLSDYGKLARLDVSGLRSGARVENTGKKNITDFALWKFSPGPTPGIKKRDMQWESPWGIGFPGWHLECSAMIRELLGDTIDIHTGGIDHIPVHHTNEIAQSESVTGEPLANMWVHANHMKVNGTKISKSLGNVFTLDQIVSKNISPMAFRLLVLTSHYRTESNFTWEILDAAKQRLKRWQDIACLRWQLNDTLDDDDTKDNHDTSAKLLSAPHAALEALNTDLDTPAALVIIESAFGEAETTARTRVQKTALSGLVEFIDETLGLALQKATPDITEENKMLILRRLRARENQDWKLSDEIRDQLLADGISLKDTASGTTWTYASVS